MPRLTQITTATTTATTEVKLSTTARQMLTQRLDEYGRLAKQLLDIKGTKKTPGRMRRIQDEVQELFRKEKQGKALRAGCKIGDTGVKLVTGERSVFDKLGFMQHHGLTQTDFDAFTEKVDNAPYIKISIPGVEDE